MLGLEDLGKIWREKIMPEVGSPLDIIQRVREDTALFEDPLPWYLKPCSAEEVGRVSHVEDPIEFAAEVYNLVRRVEAAAAKHAHEDEPRVREAAEMVMGLEYPIRAMEAQIQTIPAQNTLEEAGKAYLLDRFLWAQGILNDRLEEWGY